MKKTQTERNDLLRYVLKHPPANVTVRLPEGSKSVDSIDLTLCPTPLRMYEEAEKAAAHAKGGKVPAFVFDMTDCITFVGGSSGGVQRAGNSNTSSRSKKDTPITPEAKADGSSSVSPRRSQRPATDASAPSPSPNAEKNASPDRHGKAEASQSQSQQQQQQRLVATEQSPPHAVSGHASPSNTSATEPEPSKGFFGHIVNTFRGLTAPDPPPAASTSSRSAGASASNSNNNNNNNPASAASPASSHSPRNGTRSNAVKTRSGRSGSAGSLFSSLWNPLASVHGTRGSGSRPSTAPQAAEEAASQDTASRMEQLQIPLCGNTAGTMSEAITRQFGPLFESVEERRRASASSALVSKGFPRPPSIQLCEVVNSAPLTPFLDLLPVFAYDNLVLCTCVLQMKRRTAYESEMQNVYRRVFNISDEQHRRSLANVTPPSLKTSYDSTDPAAVAQRRRCLADLHFDAPLLQVLADRSSDDEFVARTEQLLYCIENFPDNPGDHQIPFAIRAMVYAACLLPLYQLDLSTLSPIFEEKDVENCLALLRARLGISTQVEQFCHLHAQLLANDQCGSIEAQAVFLKDVARAVSSLGTRNFADSELTPPVKYAYYVLQETFCLAAVPMPWLDSTFSYDMQRSVSAVFIETCLALPSCMLSAMLLVEDMPVLPPSASGEAFLLSFMEVFVNSGVFRNYAELVDDGGDGSTASASLSLSASALLQQVSSGLDTTQQSYCKMLTRSFPLAMLLLVPGRLRIGAYIILERHWGGAFPNAQNELPKDFQAAMDAFLYYLLDGCCGEKRTCQSESLCSMMVRATQTYLAAFSVLSKAEETSFTNFAAQQLEKLQPQWAATLKDAGEPLHDVRRFLRTVFGAPRPPPLGSDPSSQQHARLANWMNTAVGLLKRCMEGVPQVAVVNSAAAKMPYLAAECERIRNAVAARCGCPDLLSGTVQRLHTIVRVKEGVTECLARSHRQYELVRRVSGAPAVTMDEFEEKHCKYIYDAVLQLCDTISIEILSSDTMKDLLERFMRLDAKQYQSMKQQHGKNDDFPMPRASPEVTMRAILDELTRETTAVCGHLDYEPAARQVRYRVGHNFVACLFAVYVDGPGVFLSTADAPLILADLDLVRTFFFEAQGDASPNASAADMVNTACQTAAHVLRTSGAELLEKLYGIVQYVMSKPSTELNAGGVGVPPLHTLPESSDDSPWCQYVVRRVLEHRKDFKRSVWNNYQARQRTKSMF